MTFQAVIQLKRFPQSVHLGRNICGMLGAAILWPQLLYHSVRLQGGLRIHILKQDFQQLLELVLAGKALTAQDLADLVPGSVAVHRLGGLPMLAAQNSKQEALQLKITPIITRCGKRTVRSYEKR
jgi:hypothetical protein